MTYLQQIVAFVIPAYHVRMSNNVVSLRARQLAFAAIVVFGYLGAVIGYAFSALQCQGSCDVQNGASMTLGALITALGAATVAVLALRALPAIQEENRSSSTSPQTKV
jgi:hypothetical protein